MARIDQMAKDAGFLKPSERHTCTANVQPPKVFGMDLVTTPLMPEGYAAIRSENGAMVIGPKGCWWVPFNPKRTG